MPVAEPSTYAFSILISAESDLPYIVFRRRSTSYTYQSRHPRNRNSLYVHCVSIIPQKWKQ